MNFRDLLVIDANGNELDEAAVITDNTQRAVSGVHQLDSRGHDPMQHLLEFKLATDRDDRLKQRAHAVSRVERRLKAHLEFTQQIIQAQIRKQRF